MIGSRRKVGEESPCRPAQVTHRRDVPAKGCRLEGAEHETAAIAPGSGSAFDGTRSVVEGERGLEERDAIVVSIGIGSGEMKLSRRPSREVRGERTQQVEVESHDEILGLAVLVLAARDSGRIR